MLSSIASACDRAIEALDQKVPLGVVAACAVVMAIPTIWLGTSVIGQHANYRAGECKALEYFPPSDREELRKTVCVDYKAPSSVN
ncbi:hypothetical protein C0063_12480 [Pseudoxanthomonas sp. KAs_5_3]|nr:hypothetical protein C0063_12480 [Pseudoxanthomonas sp. KAs_5_3]